MVQNLADFRNDQSAFLISDIDNIFIFLL